MRSVALAAMALTSISQAVCGQPADDTFARFKSCLQLDGAARRECLEKLSQELAGASAPPVAPAPWVISETTSPVDYSPQITAVLASQSAVKDAPSSFAMRCRGARTEVLVSTAGSWRPSSNGEFKVSYRINDQPAVEGRWAAIAGGGTAVFNGDVIQFLRSLPERGRILISVYDWQGPAHDATFQFSGLEDVRRKIAEACKWPEGGVRRR
jgi:hypothetical protein